MIFRIFLCVKQNKEQNRNVNKNGKINGFLTWKMSDLCCFFLIYGMERNERNVNRIRNRTYFTKVTMCERKKEIWPKVSMVRV